VVGCGPAPAEPSLHEQMERYQAALSEEPATATTKLEACGALQDPDLAGDCALKAAHRAIRHGHGEPDDLCPRLPGELWQAECWFEAAELAGRKSAREAIALCDRASPFVEDCRQHLWQDHVKRLVDQRGPDGFGELLPQAQELHDAWELLLGEGAEFEFRFWRRYYQAGLGAMSPLDLEVCEPLPALHRERCLEAAVAGWRERLEQALDRPKTRSLICDTPPGRLDAALDRVGQPFEALPHPRLSETSREVQREGCAMFGHGGMEPS
jgi:hypothetical protein